MTETSSHNHSRNRLTFQILVALLAGAATGLLLSAIAPKDSFLDQSLTNGLFEILGSAFMALLQVLVVPLVFVSLVCGTAALEDVRKLGRIGLRTVSLYLFTTAVAISIALISAVLIGPGRSFDLQTEASFEASQAPSLIQVIKDLFPSNILSAMSEGNMLQIILFAILFGLALTFAGKAGQRLLAVLKDLNEVIMQLVWIVMRLAPIGVFALIAGTFASQGFAAFAPLLKYFFLVLAVLLLHAFLTYPLLLRTLAGLPPLRFLAKLRELQIFAFSTASSNATIPVTLHTTEHKLGVHNSVASFTVPLGATINMDGTAIMQGVATVFIAQAYGMGLGFVDYLTVIAIATLASIGTAGVPGVGLIMLSMVLTQVGLPVEGIGLILGIDRLLDMVRTAVNVTGDSAVTCIVAKSEDALDQNRYHQPLHEMT